MAGAVVHAAPSLTGAQAPTQPPARPTPADTARPGQPPAEVPPTAPQPGVTDRRSPGDTVPRPAQPDTARRRDTTTVAVPVPPGARDTLRADSVAQLPDSLRPKRDSILAPFARAELPVDLEAGPAYRWTREQLFATGALSVADLLARIPGVTDYRSGWIASAQVSGYQGDVQRVRVFRDGVEIDVVNPRAGGTFDLVDVQIWQLDELAIERTAGELRVHMRTWTVRNRTAYTRVDVYTGDEDTNFYRGFYGIRFGGGWAFQAAAQQYGTGTRARRGGGGDMFSPFVRFGWAQKKLSIDALYTRVGRTRDPTLDITATTQALPREEIVRNEATLRVAYGDPQQGAWAQLIGSALDFTLEAPEVESGSGTDTTAALADTSRSRTQLVAAAGYARGGASISLTNRLRRFDGRTFQAPALRLGFDRSRLSASVFAERTGHDSTTRLDASARLLPVPFVALIGGMSRYSQDADTGDVSRSDLRAEVALRVGRLWVSGGRLERDGAVLRSPLIYGTIDTTTYVEDRAGGTTLSLRGPIWRGLAFDAHGVQWDEAGIYRPKYETRAELSFASSFLSRFPRNDFGLKVAIIDEYRTETFVPAPYEGERPDSPVLQRIPPFNQLSALVEIRIMSAVLTYQLRNALVRRYENVPQVLMPGPVNFYGVRWDFSN